MRKAIIGFFLIVGLNGTIIADKHTERHGVKVIPVKKVSLQAEKRGTPVHWTKHQKVKKSKKVRVAKRKSRDKFKIIKTARKYLGVKYRYGGTTRKGIDCSAFVKTVYKRNKVNLPRTSRQQYKVGKIVSKSKAKKGDLIFFSRPGTRGVGHVGIIIDPKKKLMIHASSGAKKVTISCYEKRYYRKHFKGIRRV